MKEPITPKECVELLELADKLRLTKSEDRVTKLGVPFPPLPDDLINFLRYGTNPDDEKRAAAARAKWRAEVEEWARARRNADYDARAHG